MCKSKHFPHFFSKLISTCTLLKYNPLQLWYDTGETTVKWVPSRAAVVSYAQYLTLGDVLPLTYDPTVLTRWGVDLTIAAPVISITATPAVQREYSALSLG